MSSLIATTGWVARRGLLVVALSFIGLFVGFSCVLLPQGIPFGIVALAGLVLLWVLPALRSVPDRLSRLMYYPFVVSNMSVPSYYALVFPGMPWISFRRSILFIFVGAVMITVAGSSVRRAQIMTTLRSFPLLLAVVGGYYALLWINTFVSVMPSTSLTAMVNDTLGNWIPLLATVMFVTDRKMLERMLMVLLCCAIFDCAVGAIESYLRTPFLIYLLPPAMRAELVLRDVFFQGLIENSGIRNGLYRATSTFNVPLSWGEMSAMMAPIALFFLAHGRNARAKSVGALGYFACFLSVVMSGSRGAYVGFIAGTIVYFLLWALRRNRTHPQSIAGGITLVLYSLFSIAVMFSVFFVPRIRSFVLGGSDAQASNDGRHAEWAMAWPKIFERPILGHGPGTAGEVVGYVNPAGQGSLDSFFINLLVDTGFPGFALFMGSLVLIMYYVFVNYVRGDVKSSVYGNSIGCALLSYAIYRSSLSQTENETLRSLLIGCTFAMSRLCALERSKQNSPTPKSEPLTAHSARPVFADRTVGPKRPHWLPHTATTAAARKSQEDA